MLVVSFHLQRVLTFLEPYILGNVLASEWQQSNSKNYPYMIVPVEAYDLGMRLWKKFGFEPTPRSGICKVVYVHRTCVIKIPIHEAYAPGTSEEIDDINTRWPDPADRIHFPYTMDVGSGVAVQERCRIDKNEYELRQTEIMMLADRLGISDTHDDNIGFEQEGPTIKFFDVQRQMTLYQMGCVLSTKDRLKEMQAAGVASF